MEITYTLIPVAAFSPFLFCGSRISPNPQSGGTSLNPPANEIFLRSVVQIADQTSEATADAAVFDLPAGEGGMVPTVRLNSGYEMPIAGTGIYSLLDDGCVNSIASTPDSGVQSIDTAYMYHNETAIGRGIRQSGALREEIFLTTKLYSIQSAYAAETINEALGALGVEYIDLMPLHYPSSGDVQAYKAMEQAVAGGKIHSIGLSNWYIEEIDTFLPQVVISPAVVQNEIHLYYQESEVIGYMYGLGIVMEGWYPLGGRGRTRELLNDEAIVSITRIHGRSAAWVILRWNLQKGAVVIPGSSNPEYIRKNISLFDLELTKEEMERINAPNRGEKYDWYQQEVPHLDQYASVPKIRASADGALRNRRQKVLKAYSVCSMSRHIK